MKEYVNCEQLTKGDNSYIGLYMDLISHAAGGISFMSLFTIFFVKIPSVMYQHREKPQVSLICFFFHRLTLEHTYFNKQHITVNVVGIGWMAAFQEHEICSIKQNNTNIKTKIKKYDFIHPFLCVFETLQFSLIYFQVVPMCQV